MADKDDPCDLLKGTPGYDYCAKGQDSGGSPGTGKGGSGITDGATSTVRDLADSLIEKINALIAPKDAWAPAKADSGLYGEFLWLGQHLAVAIFVCVVVVCALTAWQGVPRLRQMGASTGWALAAVAGMASVPGAVMLLNKAVSSAFTAMFSSDESTLFGAISHDMDHGADAGNPLAVLIILAALVVALAFAALVFMTRQLGILVFVCMAPLVLASLARGGDTSAVKTWAGRLLGLMFAPFALLLLSPFVAFAKGSLVVDAVLLVAADALMLRMIFHGVPYFGPKVARGARALVERRTDNRLAGAVVQAGAPDVYEKENAPRGPRTVDTPRRAMSQDRGVLFAAYGVTPKDRPGRLTTASAVAKETREASESRARREQLREVRQRYRPAPARAGAPAASPSPPPTTTRGPAPAPTRPPTP
jgi:multisubunit Na+/H+ antiporter MnhC subunit